MKISPTAIPEVLVIEPTVYADQRGFFFESFNQKKFVDAVGYPVSFVQDNHSKSQRGVLRGLHYQLAPYAQGKLVRVTSGSAFDVAVDLRKKSKNYGKWVACLLSASNKKQLWIPAGFAHGFLALEPDTEFLYKTTDFYEPSSERAIRWYDPTLNIDWPPLDCSVLVNSKDQNAHFFVDAATFD